MKDTESQVENTHNTLNEWENISSKPSSEGVHAASAVKQDDDVSQRTKGAIVTLASTQTEEENDAAMSELMDMLNRLQMRYHWSKPVLSVASTVKSAKSWNCSSEGEEWWALPTLMLALTHHEERDRKVGKAFFPGTLKNGKRNNASVEQIDWLVFDVDNKDPDNNLTLDNITERLRKAPFTKEGYCAVIYSTYSHLQIIEKDGKKLDPAEKYRIVMPLRDSYYFEAGHDRKEREAEWEWLYVKIAKSLELEVDPSCIDPGRAYFLPSKPPGSESVVRIIEGELIDYRSFVPDEGVPTEELKQFRRSRKNYKTTGVRPNDVGHNHSRHEGDGEFIYTDAEGQKYNLKAYAVATKNKLFDLRAVLAARSPDMLNGHEHDGWFCLTECPFEDEHTSNPNESNRAFKYNDEHGLRFNCMGAACSDRDRLAYVLKMLEDGWITIDDLENPEYGGVLFPTKSSDWDLALTAQDFVRAATHTEIEEAKKREKHNISSAEAIRVIRKGRVVPEPLVELFNDMNNQHATITIKGKQYILFRNGNDIDFMNLNSFRDKYVAQKINMPVGIAKNDEGNLEIVYADVKTAQWWLDYAQKGEYDRPIFRPYPVGEKDPAASNEFNMWRGFATVPKEGVWSLMQAYMQNVVCNGDKQHFDYLMLWLAHMFQKPDEKPEVAIGLYSRERGTGKSFLWDRVREIVGPDHSFYLVHTKHLTGNFNSWMEKTIFAAGDEVIFSGDRQGEQVQKALITSKTFPVERKHVDTFNIDNFLRLGFTTNDADAFRVDERRWFVLEVGTKHKQDRTYFGAIKDEFDNGGKEAMMFDLMNYTLEGKDVNTAPKTPLLHAMQEHHLEHEEAFMLRAVENGGVVINTKYGPELRHLDEDETTSITKIEVYQSYREREKYPHPDSVFAKNMKSMFAVVGDRETEDGERKRIFVFPPLSQLRTHFSERGIEFVADDETADSDVLGVE